LSPPSRSGYCRSRRDIVVDAGLAIFIAMHPLPVRTTWLLSLWERLGEGAKLSGWVVLLSEIKTSQTLRARQPERILKVLIRPSAVTID
jgi:hypothetical protein